MSRTQTYRGALEAIERILNRGGDAEDVVAAVLSVLRARGGYASAAIVDAHGATPIVFDGVAVGGLDVSPPPQDDEERAFLERVATLVSPYCRP